MATASASSSGDGRGGGVDGERCCLCSPQRPRSLQRRACLDACFRRFLLLRVHISVSKHCSEQACGTFVFSEVVPFARIFSKRTFIEDT
ncbi:hypothetical protein ACP70R_024277 [Stipagrostis hirtigluma subsp. patula]